MLHVVVLPQKFVMIFDGMLKASCLACGPVVALLRSSLCLWYDYTTNACLLVATCRTLASSLCCFQIHLLAALDYDYCAHLLQSCRILLEVATIYFYFLIGPVLFMVKPRRPPPWFRVRSLCLEAGAELFEVFG